MTTFKKTGVALCAVFGVGLMCFGANYYAAVDGTGDGLTSDTPTTLKGALAAAVNAGDEIVLKSSAQPYKYGATIVVTNGVTLRSESGDFRDVVLSGERSHTVVRLLAADSVISGVTVTDGKYQRDRIGASEKKYGSAGIHIRDGGMVTNCFVYGNMINSSTEPLAGVGIHNINGTVADTIIASNTNLVTLTTYIRMNGVGYYQTGSAAVADRCVITNNIGPAGKGAAYNGTVGAYCAGGIIRNSLIMDNHDFGAGNSNDRDVGVGVHLVSGRMENCAVIGNHYHDAFDSHIFGVYANSGSTVKNCVIDDNGLGTGARVNFNDALRFSSCATMPIDGISDGLLIGGADYLVKNGIFQLSGVSSLIDKGAEITGVVSMRDLYGNGRVNGNGIDIGPVEYYETPGCLFTASQLSGYDSYDAVLTPRVWGVGDDAVVEWSKTVTDNKDGTFTIRIADIGTVTPLMLTLKSGNGEVLATYTLNFESICSTHYVISGNPNAKAPYASWEDAAATISDALAVAGAGSSVIVEEGVYREGERIIVPVGVTLRSASGRREDVILDGGLNQTTVVLDGENSVLKDVTVTRGKYGRDNIDGVVQKYGSAGVLIRNRGVVTNCVVVGNYSTGTTEPARGIGINNNNGMVIDTVIACNTNAAASNGYTHIYGTAYYQGGADAVTERCFITNNMHIASLTFETYHVSIDGGIVKNSLIAANGFTKAATVDASRESGLYVTGGKVENCTIIENTNAEPAGTTAIVSGVYATGGTFVNTLIAGNATTNCLGAVATYRNCVTTDATGLNGEGNIEDNGQSYKYGADGRLTLTTLSPCFNNGLELEWMADAHDIYGNRRLYGRLPDIGAVELQRGLGLFIVIK